MSEDASDLDPELVDRIAEIVTERVEKRVAEMLEAHKKELAGVLPGKLKGAAGQINLKDFWTWVKPLLKTLGEDRRGIRPIPLEEIFFRTGSLSLEPETYRNYLLQLDDLGRIHLRPHQAPLTLDPKVREAGIEHPTRGFLYFVNLKKF